MNALLIVHWPGTTDEVWKPWLWALLLGIEPRSRNSDFSPCFKAAGFPDTDLVTFQSFLYAMCFLGALCNALCWHGRETGSDWHGRETGSDCQWIWDNSFWGDKSISWWVFSFVNYTVHHWSVQSKRVNLMVCELYLEKTVIWKIQKWVRGLDVGSDKNFPRGTNMQSRVKGSNEVILKVVLEMHSWAPLRLTESETCVFWSLPGGSDAPWSLRTCMAKALFKKYRETWFCNLISPASVMWP